jgi:hypothetical protein
LSDLVDGETILKRIFKKWVKDTNWIDLAQDRDRWRTLVKAVMNLRVSQNVGNFMASCKPVSFSRRAVLRGGSYDKELPRRYKGVTMFSPSSPKL